MLLHGDVPSTWTAVPALVATVDVAALLYVRGWRTYHRRLPERFPRWRLVAFLCGLTCLWAALASPIDAAADVRLSAHMAQHILLLTAAPALLLLGDPFLPILRGLPRAIHRIVGPIARQKWPRRAFHGFTHPAVTLLLSFVILYMWHLPAPFQLAVRVPAVHVVEHAAFFVSGLLFWCPVVQPWPSRPRWPEGAMIPYLLAADIGNTALAAVLTFADRVLYPIYQAPPRGTELTALGDQVLAGVVMWVPMSLAYLVPAAVLTVRLLAPNRQPDVGRGSPFGEGAGDLSLELHSRMRKTRLW
jgi:putative membrane protein